MRVRLRWRRTAGVGPTEPAPSAPSRDAATGDERLELTVSDVSDLAATALDLAGSTAGDLTVVVQDWQPPAGRRVPPPPAHTALAEFTVLAPVADVDLRLRLRFAQPQDVGSVLIALVRVLAPAPGRLGAGSPDVAIVTPADRRLVPWVSRASELLTPSDRADRDVRRTDLAIHSRGDLRAVQDTVEAAAHLLVDERGVHDPGLTTPAGVVLDPVVHRPVGRSGLAAGAEARLTVEDGQAVVRETGPSTHETVRCRLGTGLGVGAVRALATIGSITLDEGAADPAVLGLLTQLSACGVVVHTPGGAQLPGGSPLQRLWAAPLPPSDDLFAMTAASVAQRRTALRSYSVDAVLGQAWLRATGTPPDPDVSVLLVTMRPERLAHALQQVAASAYPRLQVVLGLHGAGFRRTDVDRLVTERLPHRDVVVVELADDLAFGAALGQVTARADGALVTKMDDDDVYGPEHVADLVIARSYSGAEVVGKPPEYVYLEPLDVTVRRPHYAVERYGTFVAGGTIMLSRADLESVGGWRPVPRSVDRALLDRVLRDGGLVYATHGLGYLYVRHGEGHTWDPGTSHFLRKTEQQWPGMLAHEEFGTSALGPGAVG